MVNVTAGFYAAFNQFNSVGNFEPVWLAVNKTMLTVQVAGGCGRENNFGGVKASWSHIYDYTIKFRFL